MLRVGSEGDEVRDLQKALLRKGINAGAVDGIFGSKTEDAVKRFQDKEGLQVDGIVGPNTAKALGLGDDEEESGTAPSMY